MGEDGRVTLDHADPVGASDPVGSSGEVPGSADPIERYRLRMRRLGRRYVAALVGVAVALLVTVIVAWNHGENAHVVLHTTAHPPAALAPAAIADAPTLAWHTSDRSAIGTPYWNGTAVTYSAHTVTGRNLTTGAITWSYRRSDRTVCQVIQSGGVSIAIYRLSGNCNEVNAFDSATGQRRWSRTLDKDGHPLDGTPTYSIGQFTLLITTPAVAYAIDPNGGLDRWTFSQTGCSIRSAVIGTQGALISQTCTSPACSGVKFCGSGPQLLLRDGNASRVDDSAKANGNPDQIKWNLIGNNSVPVSADQLVSSLDTGAGALDVLDVTKGSQLSHLAVRSSVGPILAQSTARAEVIWLGGVTYSVETTGADYFWSTPTAGPPSVTSSLGEANPATDLTEATVVASTSGGVVVLDPGSGVVRRTIAVSGAAAEASVFPVGTGFLISSTDGSGTAVYQ
jgi:hypothetical protein